MDIIGDPCIPFITDRYLHLCLSELLQDRDRHKPLGVWKSILSYSESDAVKNDMIVTHNGQLLQWVIPLTWDLLNHGAHLIKLNQKQ